jgi:hypothetical protein
MAREDEEAGGDQQYQADRDLRGDQRIEEPPGGAYTGGGAGLFQCGVEVGVGSLERRKQAESDPGGEGET